MKTIKQPITPSPLEMQCGNKDCCAVMLCEKSELERYSDQRDGSGYILTCPHCKQRTWVDDGARK